MSQCKKELQGGAHLCLIAQQLERHRIRHPEGQELEGKCCSVKLKVDAHVLQQPGNLLWEGTAQKSIALSINSEQPHLSKWRI